MLSMEGSPSQMGHDLLDIPEKKNKKTKKQKSGQISHSERLVIIMYCNGKPVPDPDLGIDGGGRQASPLDPPVKTIMNKAILHIMTSP